MAAVTTPSRSWPAFLSGLGPRPGERVAALGRLPRVRHLNRRDVGLMIAVAVWCAAFVILAPHLLS
jgi:hypothetical protein